MSPASPPAPDPAHPTARRSQRATPKVQRWVDLLAALLRRRFPATFQELAREVPAYADAGKAEGARQRMFERDKDELRDFGIPIRSEVSSDGESHGYRLDRRDFYMPYLALVTAGGRASPRRVDRDGYHSLPTLDLTPDALAAVARAASHVRELGDPRLAADAASALRKLTFDLPTDALRTDDATHVVSDDRSVDPAVFDALGGSLRRRKRVSFDYRSMSSGEVGRRTVDGYGIFFLGGHWYFVGRDVARDALRNFRLSRMSAVDRNAESPQSPDYDVPAGFHLRDHARARSAWELGDAAATDAVVEFRRRTGAALAAARLGEPLGEPEPDDAPVVRRRYHVRRVDSFARWLLALGGDAVPVAPEPLVERFRSIAHATLALYDRPADGGADE